MLDNVDTEKGEKFVAGDVYEVSVISGHSNRGWDRLDSLTYTIDRIHVTIY